MKTHWIVIRIVLALVAIFALGVWVGRMTAPAKEADLVMQAPEGETVSEEQIRNATRRAMKRYRKGLGLSGEEIKKLRPLFLTISRRMEVLPKRSKARLLVLEEFHEELNQSLTPEQKVKADKLLKHSRSMERK